MTSIVIVTLALASAIVAPYSLVRIGRWTAAAYRNWVIGAVILFALIAALILSRFGRA